MSENSETIVKRTIVELDLVGYSDIARYLEEHLGANAVMQLNKQIQSFVNDGLVLVQIPRRDAVNSKAGDNAIVVFERASDAHRFAEAFHRITEQYNAGKTELSAERHFRLGISTGNIAIEGDEIAGTTIIDSCRLEAGGNRGHILITTDTFKELPAEYQNSYAGPEILKDKRAREHQVYRYAVVEKAYVPEYGRNDGFFNRLKNWVADNKKKCARAACAVLAGMILTGVYLATEPMRKTSAVNTSVTAFLKGVQSGEYTKSYSYLTRASQKVYPLTDFIADHSGNSPKIQDFTVVQVSLNKSNRNRAFARISSTSKLYGQKKLKLELMNDDGAWNVIFNKSLAAGKPPQASAGKNINNFMKSLLR